MGIEAAIIGSSIIGAGASAIGAGKQAGAARDAANMQAEASRENIAFQREVFNQQREDLTPWREVGSQAIQQLSEMQSRGQFDPGAFRFNFEADPGAEFRRNEALRALDASAASRGLLLSGAQIRASERLGSDLGSQEYNNAFNRALSTYSINAARKGDEFNRLATLSGIGQSANQATGAAAQTMAGNVGNALSQMGAAQAAGAIGAGNAWAQGAQGVATSANQGLQNFLLMDMLKGGR